MARKIVGATRGANGNIKSVLIEGNKNNTSIEKAFEMAEKGSIDAVPVTKSDGSKHIRSPSNGTTKDNLGNLADK